jgi:hypothetical protein
VTYWARRHFTVTFSYMLRPWSESVWFSPGYIIEQFTVAMMSGDRNRIKRMKEAWIASVASISRSHTEGDEWWIQIPRNDPPDVLAMRLVPTIDKRGQHLSELKIEVFEISEFDDESIKESVERKLQNTDYGGMIVIGFVRRMGSVDVTQISKHIISLSPKAGSVCLAIGTGSLRADVSLVQVFPELIKYNVNLSLYQKNSNQRAFIDVKRGSKKKRTEVITTDTMTIVPPLND